MASRQCAICGIRFEAEGSRTKYCSAACRNEGRRENHRRWLQANPDKVREHRRRNYLAHSDKVKERSLRYYQEHTDEIRKRIRLYRREHLDKFGERERRYRLGRAVKIRDYETTRRSRRIAALAIVTAEGIMPQRERNTTLRIYQRAAISILQDLGIEL